MIKEDFRVKEVRELWRRWLNARREWENQAREDIDFYLGNHYSEAENDELEARNQSNVPLDRLYSAIEQFKAIITSKPPKFSAVGREDSDNNLANVWKTLLEYIWDISDGNEVFKQVVHDYAVTGLGYFYAYIDMEDDYGRGEVKFTYVDPFRVVIDPNARNKWFDDANGMMLSTILTKLQLLDLYPQLKEETEEGKMLIDEVEGYNEGETFPSNVNKRTVGSFTPDYIKDLDHGEGSQKYQLIEYFSKIKVPYYRIMNMETQEERIVDKATMSSFITEPDVMKAVEKGMIDVLEVQQTRIKLTCTLGQIVLYERILDTDKYPIVPVPNIWTNTPYPMSDVRKNKDFQRYLNKVMSLITSHAQASSGLKLLVPQGSVDDIEELEKDWANPNATIEYDPSMGEPHFPSPQPLSNSVMQLPQMIAQYIDLNMGIFEMMQGNTEVAPRTSSATMMMEDFGQRRSKSKLRDIEGSLKRLGMVIYNLAKSHYNFQKSFRIAQPNNDLTEFTINQRMYDDKSKELQTIQNDITVGHFDIRIIGNSTMPSNKWGEWNIYMEAYQAGLIDRNEALKKTEIFDKEGVLGRMDTIKQLQQQLQMAQEQIKNLSGDLQTASRESVASRKRTEVEKFKTQLKSYESDAKAKNQISMDKIKSAVNLETEKMRIANQSATKELQKGKK
jgi:hypothetical protein|tara:strand:- start:1242 stop:3263 length:2022 start_codon:yes stop_codon:yes gene_type:complete